MYVVILLQNASRVIMNVNGVKILIRNTEIYLQKKLMRTHVTQFVLNEWSHTRCERIFHGVPECWKAVWSQHKICFLNMLRKIKFDFEKYDTMYIISF
jgi:hypothetical protein